MVNMLFLFRPLAHQFWRFHSFATSRFQWSEMALSVDVQERIAAVQDRVIAICEQFNSDPDAPIFALRDEALTLLKSQNLIRSMRYHPRHVAVHPKNRYGDGIIPNHVQDLTTDFAKGGFSLIELGVPFATEMPPNGHERHGDCLQFIRKIVEESNGVLPSYADDDVKILSATKSHTSQSTRCVVFGMPHDYEPITENGHLSLHKVMQLRPEYARVCEEGFEWDVLVWQAEDAFSPGIVELLQEAGNAGHGIGKAETRLEVCLKMHGKAQKLLSQPNPPADVWDHVEREASRAKSTFASEIPELRKFVEKFAGGSKAVHLEQFVSFQRTLKHPRIVQGSYLAAIAGAVLGTDGRGCNNFRVDLIKAMMSASDKFADKEGKQTLFSSVAELNKKLGDKKVQAMIQMADKMKAQGAEKVKDMLIGASRPHVQTALDLFGIRLIHLVTLKPDSLRGKFNSLHDVGHTFVQELSNITGTTLQSPWVNKPASNDASSSTAAPQKATMTQFSSSGVVNRVAELASSGVVVSAHVQRKSDQLKFKVDAVSDDKVVLRRGEDTTDIDTGAFLKGVLSYDYKVLVKHSEAKEETRDVYTNTAPRGGGGR
jgi:tryptophan synthase alpha subunit